MKKPNTSMKTYLLLHLMLMIFSLGGICSKLAGAEPFLSIGFIFYYGLMIVIMGVYAFVWQKILKQMPLVTAFANKAVSVFWGMLWGYLIFHEPITLPKLLGCVIVFLGVILVVTDEAEVAES